MGIDNQEQAETNKILMVIAPQLFRDQEYTEPRKIFEENGIEVSVASIQGGKAIGAEGTEVNIDLTVSEVSVEDFEAVVFIGGPGMAQIIDDESLQVLAKKFYNAGKLTAAICVAPSILAKAGIFDNKRATVWADNKDDLIAGGADYTGESVTIDGKIITADGPSSAKEFGEKIAEALK
ncbi:MAG: DJ-1/PfpI family protein [Patescibacteria group bacterium]